MVDSKCLEESFSKDFRENWDPEFGLECSASLTMFHYNENIYIIVVSNGTINVITVFKYHIYMPALKFHLPTID